jgi:tetratricopeptide (TPR) repeat protein
MILSVLLVVSAQASETTRTFLDGINDYKQENFEAAISAFSKIAASGVNNSKLFYNLGNAYLKNGDLGHALLWYERALRLAPDDPDLKFNYEYALSQLKDEKDSREISIFRILFFWKHLLSTSAVQYAAIFLNLLFWLIVTVRTLQKKKKILKAPSYFALVLTVVFTLTAFYNYYEAAYFKEAVILPSQVAVRSGLTDGSAELFVLHAGTKVKIEEEHNDFFKIFFSEGKIGYIRKSDVGVI